MQNVQLKIENISRYYYFIFYFLRINLEMALDTLLEQNLSLFKKKITKKGRQINAQISFRTALSWMGWIVHSSWG